MLSSPGKVASRNPGLLSKLDLITARSSCSIHQRSGGGRSGDCFAVLPRAPPTPACYLPRPYSWHGHGAGCRPRRERAARRATRPNTCTSPPVVRLRPTSIATPEGYTTGSAQGTKELLSRNAKKKVMPPSSEYFSRPSMGRRSRCDTPPLPSTAKRSPWM